MTLALENGEPFQVWILDAGQPPDASDFASIDPEEKLRCLRRARERDRQLFVNTRAARRYLGVAPKSVRFAQNPAIHPFGASHPSPSWSKISDPAASRSFRRNCSV